MILTTTQTATKTVEEHSILDTYSLVVRPFIFIQALMMLLFVCILPGIIR